MASGLGSCAYALAACHPDDSQRPLVDMGLVLVLTPALLLGVSAGVLANAVAPNWVITCAIIGVLGIMSTRTLRVARRLRGAEQRTAAALAPELVSEAADDATAPGTPCAGVAGPYRGAASNSVALPAQLLQLLALWAAFVALQLARAGRSAAAGRTPRCTPPRWRCRRPALSHSPPRRWGERPQRQGQSCARHCL